MRKITLFILFTLATSVSGAMAKSNDRFDRNVDHSIKYAYQGEILMGASISFGDVQSNNSEVMLLLDGIDADGRLLSIKPYAGYFYRDNRCAGVRFGYSSMNGNLGGANINLGASNDIEMSIPYVGMSSESFSCGLFHRSYVGLDKAGRAALFAEVELMGSKSLGNTAFEESEGVITRSSSESFVADLSFNPGAAVYVMPNVCATLSFGFGGLNYKSIKQYNAEGEQVGSRKSSKMSFKFNITAINFGINIHLFNRE